MASAHGAQLADSPARGDRACHNWLGEGGTGVAQHLSGRNLSDCGLALGGSERWVVLIFRSVLKSIWVTLGEAIQSRN